MESTRRVAAVFEGGVLKPLEPLDLPEHQRVEIVVTVPQALETPSPEQLLAAWQLVYRGLSDADIAEVERIALDREHFSSASAA